MAAMIGQDIKRIVSYKKKIANGFARAVDLIDAMDLSGGDYRDWDEIDRFDVNYDLYNGRLDIDLYDDPVCLNIEGEKINFEFQTITHYPLISQVANAMHGEMISRPFNPLAKDIGSFSQTLRNKKWNELLRNLLNEQILAPLQNEVLQQYASETGIADPSQLSPQDQQQYKADIQSRTAAKTPEDILQFMQNDFQTPTQRQAQQLLDYLVEFQDIRFKQQDGFKHAIITGKEIYHVGELHDEPTFELINPKYFTWGGSRDTEWIEDASWCKYERWLSIEDAIQKYSEDLSRSDFQKLLGFAEPIGGMRHIGDPQKDFVQNRVMYELSIEDGVLATKYADLDYKTKKGQYGYMNLYSDIIRKYGAEYGNALSGYGIREVHICWRDIRIMKRVTRIVNGEEVKFWRDEHYTTRPDDIKVVEVKVNEIWEGYKIGGTGGDTLYKRIRPIPGQFKSIFNPYGVKMPYFGKSYNVHMNNSKNVSIIDLGKPWQKEFDITMAMIKHDMATDIGRVFLMSLEMKPENWTWQDWFNSMRNGKILMTNLKKHGYGGINPDNLRAIDLSKASDIANKVDYLNLVRQELILSMNSNPTRMGAIGQYSTNENIVSSQSASYNQTEGYFETHRKIVENALNAFMNIAKRLYRKNNKRNIILDDITRTELEISPDFWYEHWAIEITTSTEDIRRMEELRTNMLTFLQNGMGHKAIIEMQFAKNPGDILDIVNKEDKRQQEFAQKQQQMDQQNVQMEREFEIQKIKMEQEFEMVKQERQLKSQELRTQVDSLKFLHQADADGNRIPDTVQKSEIDNASKERIKAAELALRERELNLKREQSKSDRDLKEKEIKHNKELKEKEIKQKSKSKT